MSKRVLLLSGTTDILRNPGETDNTMEEVYNLTLPSKLRYVNKHGYDLMSLRSFGKDEKTGFNNPTDLGYLRVIRCFEMLEYYDVVMWIDADSIITNIEYSIDDFQLDEDHCFYASWDWTGIETISTGNFIVQKCKSTKIMFDGFLEVANFVKTENIWGWEQTTMNIIYYQSNIKDRIKVLDHKYLGSIPSKTMFNGVWDGRPDPQYSWTNESFLCHITGIPNKNRIEVLNSSFKDFL